MAKQNGKSGDEETEQNGSNGPDLGEQTEQPKKEKMVKVRGLVNHTCQIGNTDVTIEKNKTTEVTAGQAMILQGSGHVILLTD